MRKSRILCAMAIAAALIMPSTAVHAAEVGETHTATVEVLNTPNPYLPDRGNGMARQSAGIILHTGAVLQARVRNNVAVGLDVFATDTRQDVRTTIPANGTWVSVTAKASSAVFFRLGTSKNWSSAPEVEYRVVSGDSQPLPEYKHGDDEGAFLSDWETSKAPYAVIVDKAQTILLDRVDLPVLQQATPDSVFPTIDNIIEHYRHVIASYDTWTGITDDADDKINGQSDQRYFLRADTNTDAWAYYSPHQWVALYGTSLRDFLTSKSGWGALHEYAHGYDNQYRGSADGTDIALLEVYNNIFTHMYQLGLGAPLRLYPNGKDAARAYMEDARAAAGDSWNINNANVWTRLEFMLRMIELTGVDGFASFAQDLRALHASGTHPTSLRVNDRLNHYLGANNGFNFTAWFEMNGLTLSPSERAYVMDAAPAPLPVPLHDVIDDKARSEAVAKQIGADAISRLVTPTELAKSGLTTTVTLTAKTNTAADVNGRSVSLWDGTTKVAGATWSNGTATFSDVPVGAYTVRTQYDANNVVPETAWVLADVDGVEETIDFTTPAPHSVGSTTFSLNGLGDSRFAALEHNAARESITLRDHMFEPHVYFENEYAHVSVISPEGETLLTRDFIGSQTRKGQSTFTVDAPVGTTIHLRHAEGNRSVPRDATTGAIATALQGTGKLSVTYVVTPYGLEKQKEPGTALGRYLTAVNAEIASLKERVNAHPTGSFAAEASTLIAAIRALPRDEYIAQVMQSGIFLDQLLQASRS